MYARRQLQALVRRRRLDCDGFANTQRSFSRGKFFPRRSRGRLRYDNSHQASPGPDSTPNSMSWRIPTNWKRMRPDRKVPCLPMVLAFATALRGDAARKLTMRSSQTRREDTRPPGMAFHWKSSLAAYRFITGSVWDEVWRRLTNRA